MAFWPIMIGGKRQCRHRRTQIRSPDADIDHIRDAPALPDIITIAHRLRKITHTVQGLQNFAHDILSIHMDTVTIQISQCGVQHRAPLGIIYFRTLKHRIAFLGNTTIAGQFQQRLTRRFIHVGFRIIKQHMIKTHRKCGRSIWIVKQT